MGDRGIVTNHLLFVIHLATRKVWFAGANPKPSGAFMLQVDRNLTGADSQDILHFPVRVLDTHRLPTLTSIRSDPTRSGCSDTGRSSPPRLGQGVGERHVPQRQHPARIRDRDRRRREPRSREICRLVEQSNPECLENSHRSFRDAHPGGSILSQMCNSTGRWSQRTDD